MVVTCCAGADLFTLVEMLQVHLQDFRQLQARDEYESCSGKEHEQVLKAHGSNEDGSGTALLAQVVEVLGFPPLALI